MATTTVGQVNRNRSAARRLNVPTPALTLSGGVLLMWLLWAVTAHAVTIEVDGVSTSVRTHRATVGSLLIDLGLDLHPADRVSPAPTTRVRTVRSIAIARARPVQIVVDGRTIRSASWGDTPAAVLADVGVAVDSYDSVVVDGLARELDAVLPPLQVATHAARFAPGLPWTSRTVIPVQITVARAIPMVVDDGTLPFTVRTTAQTVGEALRQAEITLHLGDRVSPSLGSEVVTGLRVTIQRSIPAVIEVDGRTIKTRTRGESVADALAELRVGVSGRDRVTPPLENALYDGIKIGVTRVDSEVIVSEEIAPFETVFVPDPNLPIDTQQVQAAGAEGITRTRYRIHYEDGAEVERVMEDTWIAQEPVDRRVAYGQRIEPQTFTAPDGTQITYWRKIRMHAFSYSAGTAGVSPSQPYYGRTYTGDPMRFGIVAVDPSIIPLRSQVYVPGYGLGDALDTGSAIRSRRIDLGYDDSNLILWNRWVDVYLLWPPPATSRITWVVPNWPRVPQ